jgi:thioredoxin 1
MTTDVNEQNFESEVVGATLPVLVDFSADWCAPCKALEPVLEDLSGEYEGRLRIVRLDIDKNPGIASTYGVRSLPTVMLFRDGGPASLRVGALAKSQLREMIEENL